MKAGPTNSLTDIAGLRVGNAQDAKLKSGVTAVLCDVENVASVHVMGGAPGTRDTDLLAPDKIVQSVDGLVLSGGSAFGLDACGGVQSVLRSKGKGFAVRGQRIPIVPGAILFDLINGGDKNWGEQSPYFQLGFQAAKHASTDFEIGSVGAGSGALTGGPGLGIKGGLGTASTVMQNGITVAALVAVNALGAPVVGEGPNFWAAPFEIDDEFGGLGFSRTGCRDAQQIRVKFRDAQSQGANTTIAIIATDAVLTKGEVNRLTIATHDGFARALWPAHTPLDGDLVFGLATGKAGKIGTMEEVIDLSAIAASTMARAIARGVYSASTQGGDIFPTWQKAFR